MLLALLLAATLLGPADVESLTAAADAVVYGQVVRRSSAWAPGGGQIFTTVVLRPIETWKGAAAGAWNVRRGAAGAGQVRGRRACRVAQTGATGSPRADLPAVRTGRVGRS